MSKILILVILRGGIVGVQIERILNKLILRLKTGTNERRSKIKKKKNVRLSMQINFSYLKF